LKKKKKKKKKKKRGIPKLNRKSKYIIFKKIKKVKAPDEKRYRKVLFCLDECVLSRQTATHIAQQIKMHLREEVQFQVSNLKKKSNRNRLHQSLCQDITQKAFNVRSVNHPFLKINQPKHTSSNTKSYIAKRSRTLSNF
ncbi:hypothetical protein RFI_08230, partial [Reticulomyxa filosa]